MYILYYALILRDFLDYFIFYRLTNIMLLFLLKSIHLLLPIVDLSYFYFFCKVSL